MNLIPGTWIGEFTYGDGYENDLKGKSVKFSMNLYIDDELIRGTSIDEEAKEFFREPAKIEGTFENNVIVFYLTYQLDSLYESKKHDHNYSSISIQYIGHLKKKWFSKSYYFEGTWEYNGSYIDEDKNSYYYSGAGVWKMKKAKEI